MSSDVSILPLTSLPIHLRELIFLEIPLHFIVIICDHNLPSYTSHHNNYNTCVISHSTSRMVRDPLHTTQPHYLFYRICRQRISVEASAGHTWEVQCRTSLGSQLQFPQFCRQGPAQGPLSPSFFFPPSCHALNSMGFLVVCTHQA